MKKVKSFSMRTNIRYGWFQIARSREKAGDKEGAERARRIARDSVLIRYKKW